MRFRIPVRRDTLRHDAVAGLVLATDVVGPENIYAGNERIGATLKRAHADATAWIRQGETG